MTQNLPPAGPPPPPPPPPPPGYPGYGYQPGGMPPLVAKTNGSAIGALVCGLMSLVMPVLLSIPAIILGIVGHRSIKRSGGVERGKGMATTGIVLGTVTILLTAGLVVFSVLVADNDNAGTTTGGTATTSVATTVGPACKGIGAPAAGRYRGSAPFHAVLVNGRGRTVDWTTRNAAWRSETVGDTELVACMSTHRRLIETCPYTGGLNIDRYTQVVRVRLVSARTGRVVSSFTLTDQPRHCRFSEWSYTTELVGFVPFKRVSAEIAAVAARHAGG